MSGWTGVALALRTTGDDGMRSRLPTYAHPLAGRVLCWHVLRTIADLRPRPRQILLANGSGLDPSVTGELPVDTLTIGSEETDDPWDVIARRSDMDADERILFVDAAAAALSLERLVSGPAGRALRTEDGRVLAVWLEAGEAARRAQQELTLSALAEDLPDIGHGETAGLFAVRSRVELARASRMIRDRIVRRLMEDGATFLLPETVLVDVDVTVASDTVIYPGVVLEGQTTIGSETVIGPGCRIIDSRIGSGVELKGWNYIVRSLIRNRAVLEPYVRRGID